MRKRQANQAGFTVVGLMITVVLSGMLIGSVIKVYSMVNEKSTASLLVEEITVVLHSALSLSKPTSRDSTGAHRGALAARMQARDMIPSSWVRDVKSINWFDTRWGRVAIGGAGNWFGERPDGFGAADGVHMFLADVPQDICLEVLNTLAPLVDYISYGASNGNRTGPTGILKSFKHKYSSSAAARQCDIASRDGQVAPAIRLAVYK